MLKNLGFCEGNPMFTLVYLKKTQNRKPREYEIQIQSRKKAKTRTKTSTKTKTKTKADLSSPKVSVG